MDGATVGMVIERLDKLAATVGMASDHFWPLLIRQQYIEAVGAFLGLLVSVSALVFLVNLYHKKFTSIRETSDEEVLLVICCIVSFAFSLAFGVASVIQTFHLFNVEYYTLMKLIHG